MIGVIRQILTLQLRCSPAWLLPQFLSLVMRHGTIQQIQDTTMDHWNKKGAILFSLGSSKPRLVQLLEQQSGNSWSHVIKSVGDETWYNSTNSGYYSGLLKLNGTYIVFVRFLHTQVSSIGTPAVSNSKLRVQMPFGRGYLFISLFLSLYVVLIMYLFRT